MSETTAARLTGRRLSRRESSGAALAATGLLFLAISLSGGDSQGSAGSLAGVAVWLGATALTALAVLSVGRTRLGRGVADGIAGGLFFAIGDISTKLATEGGVRTAFALTLIIGYLLGTSLLQVGYQSSGWCGCSRLRR